MFGVSLGGIVAGEACQRKPRLPGDGYFVQLSGIFHSNLTDIPSWSPLWPVLGIAGLIDVARTHRSINALHWRSLIVT